MIVFRAYTTVEYDMTYEFRVDTKEELIETLTDILGDENRAKAIAEGSEPELNERESILDFMTTYDCRVHEEFDNETISSVHIEEK